MNKQNDSQCVKISIIIPFYNIANYVAQCLDSILSQDMTCFEIIAVNDGSTDTTPVLLEEYAKKDSRIKLLHLKNGGVSRARNHGVRRATGEYIMFVDGDDFILPNALSKLYNYAQNNTADVVIFNYMPWIDGVFGNPVKYSFPKDKVMDAFAAVKIWLILGKDNCVWNKLIRREIYTENNISFAEGTTIGEDIPVSGKILLVAKRIFYFESTFYAYVYRSTSLDNSPRTVKYVKNLFYNIDIMGEEIKNSKWKDELSDIFYYRFIRALLDFYIECYSSGKKYKSPEELEETKIFLEKQFSKISFKTLFLNPYFKEHNYKFSYKFKIFRMKIGLYKYEKKITKTLKSI